MARYNVNRIPYTKQDELMDVLCKVLSRLRTPKAINNFLKDLLNRQERVMLVRRLLVAEQLIDGRTYRDIQKELHVGAATIARIDRWLHFGRGGFKNAIRAKRSTS